MRIILNGLQIDVSASWRAVNEVCIEARAVRDELTLRLDGEYETRRAAYEALVLKDGLRAAGEPPLMPGLALLQLAPRLRGQLPICDYAVSTAGDGTEWDSNWKFFPRQAEAMLPTEISVELTSDAGVVSIPVLA